MIASVPAPRILALVTAIALASAPTTVGAAPPGTEVSAQERGPVRADLVIEADLGDGSAVIIDRVRARADALLRKREVLPARGEQDPRLVVRIEPLGKTPGYTCNVSIHDGQGPIAGSESATTCEMCTENELVDHVEKAIDAVMPQLPAAPAPPPDPAATTTTTPTSSQITPDTPARDRSLSPIGKAGIGVAALGLVGIVAGAVVVTRPPRDVDMELDTERTEFRVPGIAVLAGGLGVLVVGLALIGVDRHRAKKRGTQTASRFGVLRF